MKVLGIDPGLTRCGYGCVEQVGRKQVARSAGVIRTEPSHATPRRLADLQADIRGLIAEQRPDVVAIERVLFQVNVSTAMAVGQASGVVMAEASAAGCAVLEYSPNEVKLAVAGWGGADKDQVERMVRTLLNIKVELGPADVADALAIALCHLAQAPNGRSLNRADIRGKITS
ncbi:MAG: crossover junction endodeoxyribonuclease RuvC [Acidimicrobiales bacterium]